MPFPHNPGVLVVLVDVVVVVVVDGTAHASQQLPVPLEALPPAGARQRPAFLLMVHFDFPLAFVRQHATASGFPHVERAAHRSATLRHAVGNMPDATSASTTAVAQATYAP